MKNICNIANDAVKLVEDTPPTNSPDSFCLRPQKLPTFSYFKGPITNTLPVGPVSLIDVYTTMTSESWKKQTDELRTITDPDKARDYKKMNFDFCTFSGTFTKRKEKELLEHSGLLCLDFDYVDNLEEKWECLLKDECMDIQMMFKSPGGKGLKVVVEIELKSLTHKMYFEAVSNYVRKTHGLEADKACSDVSRATFLPFDPKTYIHPKYL